MSPPPKGRRRLPHGQSAKRKSTAKPRPKQEPKKLRKPLRDKFGRFRKRPALPPRDARGRFVRSGTARENVPAQRLILADQSRERKAPGVQGNEYIYSVGREYSDQDEFASDVEWYGERALQHIESGFRNVIAIVVSYVGVSEGQRAGRGYGRGLVVGDFKIDGTDSEIIGSRIFHDQAGFKERFEEISGQIAGPLFVVEKLIVSKYKGT